MATQSEPGPLIATAAKSHLLPLGCRQVGRSRLWYSDQRFWVIVIEFQPSGWSKGSYLNVGAMWLWNTKNEWGFNDGYRIDTDFIPFENADQFKPLIDKMSATAALEVLCLRDKFRSISQIARHLVGHSDQVGTVFHAALASALALDVETATKLFDRIRQYPSYGRPALEQWKADSAKLAALLDEPKLFYSKVFETITQVRQNLRLPPDPGCLDFMVATNEG